MLFQLISGFQLPKPKDSKKGEVIDPFLKIEIHGASSDKQEQKSSVMKNNGKILVLFVYTCNCLIITCIFYQTINAQSLKKLIEIVLFYKRYITLSLDKMVLKYNDFNRPDEIFLMII